MPQGRLLLSHSFSIKYAQMLVPIMMAAPTNPSAKRKSVWKCDALNGGKGCESASVG